MCGMKRFGKVTLYAICVCVAFVQGWIVLKVHTIAFWILVPELIGAIPFMMINGVHGDTGGAAGVVGGTLFVATSGFVYYWVATLFGNVGVAWRRRT